MSNTATGRRRASAPVAEVRPRDAHRRERAARVAADQATSLASTAVSSAAMPATSAERRRALAERAVTLAALEPGVENALELFAATPTGQASIEPVQASLPRPAATIARPPAPVVPPRNAMPAAKSSAAASFIDAPEVIVQATDCTVVVPLSRRAARNGYTAPATGMLPRDAQRRERRRRAVTARRDISFTGLSQKVAIAAAASGMVLTVAIPTTAAVGPTDLQQASQSEPVAEAPIQAAMSAEVTFDRAALHGRFDPDAKLAEIVAASGSKIVAAESRGSLEPPLDNVVMTSPFGNRISPITGAGELHTGQDMSEACGTSVKAAAAGTVTFAGWHGYGGGNRVVVEHGNGLETTYNHLSAMDVTVGQAVGRGEVIARVGSTGASTGCHLHFEVMIEGQNVDPLGWL